MTFSEFKNHLDHLIGCINFDYNGLHCGVDPIGRTRYEMWYGNEVVTVNSVESVLNMAIFNGKSLTEVWDNITELDY